MILTLNLDLKSKVGFQTRIAQHGVQLLLYYIHKTNNDGKNISQKCNLIG